MACPSGVALGLPLSLGAWGFSVSLAHPVAPSQPPTRAVALASTCGCACAAGPARPVPSTPGAAPLPAGPTRLPAHIPVPLPWVPEALSGTPVVGACGRLSRREKAGPFQDPPKGQKCQDFQRPVQLRPAPGSGTVTT